MILIASGCRPATVPSPPEAPTEVPVTTPEPSPAALVVINVGVFLPLKGESQSSGEAALDGLVMAAEEINAKGGINGQLLRLIVRDTKSEADKAGSAVKDLFDVDKVVAVIGGVSAGSVEAALMADKLKIPMLALGSTMPGLPAKEPWVFRISSIDFFSGEVMAKFASSLGASSAIVLYDLYSEYARNLALAFGKQFKKQSIVAGEPYDLTSRDFSKQLAMIKRKNPEVVYLPVPADQAAEILKQARALGLNMPFLGTGSWDSLEFLSAAGDASNNCYFPARFNPETTTESGRAFLAAYEMKHTTPPPAMTAIGYDALHVLYEAIRASGGTDHESLREALSSTKNFPGLTGFINFNPEFLVPNPVFVLKVEDGKFKFLEAIAP